MVLSGSGRSPPPPTNRRIRLSYGAASHSSFNINSPATAAGGISANAGGAVAGGTTNESDDANYHQNTNSHDSAFLAALSPSTARYLREGPALNRGDTVDEHGKKEDSSNKMPTATINNNCNDKSNDDETAQLLRSLVKSLLGISSNDNYCNCSYTTPSPSAAFYALHLHSLTRDSHDAYLAARALMLNGEEKRAVWILEGSGLIGVSGGNVDSRGDNDENDGTHNNIENSGNNDGSNNKQSTNLQQTLHLRIESALLAGQCLTNIGEMERAMTVYGEVLRWPPVPPVGAGSAINTTNNGDVLGDVNNFGLGEHEEEKMNETYLRQWREQSLSNSALIDEGDDPRLILLAKTLCFNGNDNNNNNGNNNNAGIHPLARLLTALGKTHNSLSNPHRALPFLRTALQIDPRCIESWDYVVSRKLLTPKEEREWYESLDWNCVDLGGMGWLRDVYLVRLRGSGGGFVDSSAAGSSVMQKPAETVEMNPIDESRIMDASSVYHRGGASVGLQTPSAFSLGSPDLGIRDEFKEETAEHHENSVDQAFCNLAITHNLGKSSDVLASAAIRSYASHNLQASLAYCSLIDALDPFCRTAGYVHVATLVGLGLKRRLFQLAHRLVDADPKDALAWFAVGSYYLICGRYDLSQRHFSRSTRLDPGSAECWIGFGCSFAVCDESDQALASFRAAQNKYLGSHIPLLYMGMEYLRTNHLSLAGHFLASSQKTDPSDPLCCNELGVWAFRRGDLEDAAFWFVKALRLHVEAQSSSLSCVDEALGANGYILLNNKVGQKSVGVGSSEDNATATPLAKSFQDDRPPPSTVLCALKTPSGQSIAAHKSTNAAADSNLTDLECVNRCRDVFWEPTIYNLGQSYRKLQRYSDAMVCFEKCSSLNPVSSMLSLCFDDELLY